jgi:predicted CoA-substrate-specific enzyme activase
MQSSSNREHYYLGIDIGSVSVIYVLISGYRKIIASDYIYHHGDIPQLLRHVSETLKHFNIRQIGYNDRASDFFKGGIGFNEQVALIEGLSANFTKIGSIFSIGGETFGLTLFSKNKKYKKYISNSSCAAGTGSFLDQQADRIGLLSSAELSALAEKYVGEPPKIATRCAVFAKTDLIHCQQRGYTLEAIAAGLCKGMAHNIVDTLVSGVVLTDPVFVVGGVSRSKKVISYLSELIKHKIITPENSEKMLAYGCAVLSTKNAKTENHHLLIDILRPTKNIKQYFFEPLRLQHSIFPDFKNNERKDNNGVEVNIYKLPGCGEKIEAFLGIDIGSTSTKAVLTNINEAILLGLYTRTAGQPVKAVQNLFRELAAILKRNRISLNIKGVGTTGSGRKFIRRVIRADFDVDEITAHARAAYNLNPNVDTIIEIGGQDSKFTVMSHGQVTFSVMNYVCAAGTGSFIEEQAHRLGVSLKDVAAQALNTRAPLTSDRCTVFMERDLNHLMSMGYSRQELLAATMHSVRDNYLAKVAPPNKIGNVICFQGATAKNKALVAAFEQKLKKPIFVSQYCHLTGSLGVCLLMKEEKINHTQFRGIDFSQENVEVHNAVCTDCTNHCKLNIVHIGNEKLVWGYLCGRDESGKTKKSLRKDKFDLLSQRREVFKAPQKRSGTQIRRMVDNRNQVLLEYLRENVAINYLNLRHAVLKNQKLKHEKAGLRSNIKIGIPNALYISEHLPFWREFFSRLGYRVVVPESRKAMIKMGKEFSGSEFCAPISAWFGSVYFLLRKVDFVFLPQMIETSGKFYCYYSNYAVPLLKNSEFILSEQKLITPAIDLSKPPVENVRNIYNNLPEEIKLLQTPGDMFKSFTDAFRWYMHQKSQLVTVFEQHIQHSEDMTVVLLGRPYIALNRFMNQNVPQKLNDLQVATFYQDMLPLSKKTDPTASHFINWNHWHYGDQILCSAEYACQHHGIYPVFLTAFKCSPDSFVLSYFKEIMEAHEHPYLILQLDELGSDVGYETRIESAVRTFRTHFRSGLISKKSKKIKKSVYFNHDKKGTILIPNYDDLSCSLICAAFENEGFTAQLIEESPDSVVESLRYNDGQCLPLSAIASAAVHTIRKYDLDPTHTSIFLNALTRLSCNLPQYPIMMKKIFEQIGEGIEKVRIFATPFTCDNLPFNLVVDIFCAYALGGLLRRLACTLRPYEIKKGETNRKIAQAHETLYDVIASGNDKMVAFAQIIHDLKEIELKRSKTPRPKATIIGDLYVRDNDVFNQNLVKELESLGAEVVTTPFSYVLRLLAVKHAYILKRDNRYISLMRHTLLVEILEKIERRFYRIAANVLDESFPEINFSVIEQLSNYDLTVEHGGETAQNVLKIFAVLNHFPDIRLFVHINPIFCCPGLVSEAIFKKVERDINIPIVSITYDGTTTPRNFILAPYLHYLRQDFLTENNQVFSEHIQ